MCKDDAIQVLREVYHGYAGVLPVLIFDTYFYGSFIRGDYHDESDFLLTVDLD